MTARRLQAEIRAFCEAHADARQVARYARYFREGYDAYGVHQNIREAQRDAWIARFSPATFDRLGARLDKGLRNWAHTDILCGAVLGRFLEDRVVPISRMADWRTAASNWFLREAWKVRPDVVEPFLLERKDTAPRLIFQYATEKMTARNKARFRRARAR